MINYFARPRVLGLLAASVCLGSLVSAAPVLAGEDDDTASRNQPPVLGTPPFSDNRTNATAVVGLRIMPPTSTQLIQEQRFDLRIETQVPGATPPTLKSLRINGVESSAQFNAQIAAQGVGLESGTPTVPNLYGASSRNFTFSQPGRYVVQAVVTVDGIDYTIRNVYQVTAFNLAPSVKHVVFFLGDAMGLPIRSAARIASKGVFEGRSRGKLNMDQMQAYGLAYTPSFDSIITDSAPGMANYVSGLKQPNNALNVSPDNTPENNLDNPRVEHLWEYMKRRFNWATGVVTDSYVTDATPASVGSHSRARSARQPIAQQMIDYYTDTSPAGTPAQPATGYAGLRTLTYPLDVIMGGAAFDWLPVNDSLLRNFYRAGSTQGRTDGQNLFTVAQGLGYTVVKDRTELAAAPNGAPVLGIFSGDFRPANALGAENIPGVLDRLVARGQATIGGRTASDASLGLTATVAPLSGAAPTCGATVRDCFANVPSKQEMVSKAIDVLNAKNPNGWLLLVEQSQSDKLAHPLEYERVIYEALELDNALGTSLSKTSLSDTLTIVTADHAQPETIIGVTIPSALDGVTGYFGNPTGTDPITPGGCFTNTITAANTGSLTLSITGAGAGNTATSTRPCGLQDAVATFNDGTFPTYIDANGDGYPDDPDPTVKLVLDNGGRPTYSQDYLTNVIPLNPAGITAAVPNPGRDPNGILLTGNMPTRSVSPVQKNNGNTSVAPHTAEDVPISVSGPNSSLFIGTYDNTDVFVRMATALSTTAPQAVPSASERLRAAIPNEAPVFDPTAAFKAPASRVVNK